MYAGANLNERRLFEQAMFPEEDSDDYCHEYRFCGSLGFGGKYWQERNKVTCYLEDETPERLEVIERTNQALERVR